MSDNLLKLFVIFLLVFLNFPFTYSRNIDFVNENIQKESDCSENTLKESKVVYLTPNFVNDKNVLTQKMLSRQNTHYIIQYDYDLNDSAIIIPEGCTLEFQGGSINNGKICVSNNNTLIGNNTKFHNTYIRIVRNVENITLKNIDFSGEKNNLPKASSDLSTAITYEKGEYSVNVFNMEYCAIHGYNTGLRLKSSNVNICNNLFYDNGTINAGSFQNEQVDLMFYATTTNIRNNISICNNKCLSNFVDRNIDVGELFSENNIIIKGNICVSHSNLLTEDCNTLKKRHCIMVGYTNTSDINKIAIIADNICKHSHWSGIYVRGNNTIETLYKSKYIVNIHDNYIENINKIKGKDYMAGIAVELKEGSIIANNIIVSCDNAIDLGVIHRDNHVEVYGNQILDSNMGISIDSFGYNVNIQSNTMKRVVTGISLNEVQDADVNAEKKHAVILNNIIELHPENGACGISVFNYYCNNLTIDGNSIYGNIIGTGIKLREYMGRRNAIPFKLTNNIINNLDFGVKVEATSHLRNDGRYIDFNRFYNCNQAISIDVNSSYQLFIVEGNIFTNCKSLFGDQSWSNCVYEGRKKANNAWLIYDNRGGNDYNNSVYGYLVNPPVCFRKKKFLKGDEIVSSIGYFDKALCQESAPDASSDAYSKWRMINARLSTKQSEICRVLGQTIYDTTSQIMKYYNGSMWVKFNNK